MDQATTTDAMGQTTIIGKVFLEGEGGGTSGKVRLFQRNQQIQEVEIENGSYTFPQVEAGRYRLQPVSNEAVFEPEHARVSVPESSAPSAEIAGPDFDMTPLVTQQSNDEDKQALSRLVHTTLKACLEMLPVRLAKPGADAATVRDEIVALVIANLKPGLFEAEREELRKLEAFLTRSQCLNRYNTPGTVYYHDAEAYNRCVSYG